MKTGYTFYLNLKLIFAGRMFFWQQLGNKCFKTLIRHLIQISQLMLNLIRFSVEQKLEDDKLQRYLRLPQVGLKEVGKIVCVGIKTSKKDDFC